MNPDISLIIPFYNEEDTIPALIENLKVYFCKINQTNAEVIFVDDGSTDNSSEILKGFEHDYYIPKILKLSKNYGSYVAIRAGILHSTGKYVTFLPADLQDPLELVESLYKKCKEGYEISFAYRNNVKTVGVEKIFSKFYAQLMRKYVSNQFPKNGFDIVMFNEKVKNVLNNNIESNSSIFLQILSTGFKNGIIYYDKKERKIGKSKWTISKKIKLLIDSFVAFSFAPIRFVSVMGVIFSVLGLFWTIYLILRTILFHDLVPGWPALISVLLIGFGITNISLGIIAEYLWRTLDVSRKRPVFIIDEIIDLNYEK